MDPVYWFFHYLWLLMHTGAAAEATYNAGGYVAHYFGNPLQAFLIALKDGGQFVWTECSTGPCY